MHTIRSRSSIPSQPVLSWCSPHTKTISLHLWPSYHDHGVLTCCRSERLPGPWKAAQGAPARARGEERASDCAAARVVPDAPAGRAAPPESAHSRHSGWEGHHGELYCCPCSCESHGFSYTYATLASSQTKGSDLLGAGYAVLYRAMCPSSLQEYGVLPCALSLSHPAQNSGNL